MTEKTMFGVYKEGPVPGAVYRTDLPVPAVGPNDILVRVRAVAICGTDLHILPWTDYAAARVPVPMVFGHEFSGDIVEVGSDVKDFKPGDRVAGETHIPCNDCYQCKTDNRHICDNMKIIGVHVPGAFAEYISFPQDCAYKIPDDVSYEKGAMLEPMGVAVHGVSAAKVQDKNVLIYGNGPIGLMAVGVTKVWGAKKIVSVDLFDEKLALAKKMGADVLLNANEADVPQEVFKAFGGVGADIVMDFTGNVHAILDGFKALRKGGTFIQAGLLSEPLVLDLNENVIYKEAIVIGVTGRLMYETWRECDEILTTTDFDLTPVIGGIYPLKEYEKAFDDIFAGKPGKMLLIPE